MEAGRHLLLSNRAGARQTLGQLEAALEDADSAVACSPVGFHTGYIRQVSTSPVNTSVKIWLASRPGVSHTTSRANNSISVLGRQPPGVHHADLSYVGTSPAKSSFRISG